MDQHDSLIFWGVSDQREAHTLSAALFYMNLPGVHEKDWGQHRRPERAPLVAQA